MNHHQSEGRDVMHSIDINEALGKTLRITSLRRFSIPQREALYVRGILPGKIMKLVQISPMGDPLIIRIGQQKFAINCDTWARLELEEVRTC